MHLAKVSKLMRKASAIQRRAAPFPLWNKRRNLLKSGVLAKRQRRGKSEAATKRIASWQGGTGMRILIAEDDAALAGYLARGLCSAGDEVELAPNGDAAMTAFLLATPDLLLLDLELPGQSGFAVLAAIREISPVVPVLVLSGRAETETRIRCLELGADDCMAKPFSVRELRARCAALFRRSALLTASLKAATLRMDHPPASAIDQSLAGDHQLTLVIGCLTIRRVERHAEVAGAPLALTNREFALLEQLALAAETPVLRTTLTRRIWQEKPAETNALDVHLSALRKKLARWPGAPQILTVRGQGFQLSAASAPASESARALAPLLVTPNRDALPGMAIVHTGAAQ
jgi:DNA-binding response OmpR family regulator